MPAYKLSSSEYTQVSADVTAIKMVQSAGNSIFLTGATQPDAADAGIQLRDGETLIASVIYNSGLTGKLWAKPATTRHPSVLTVIES